MATVLSTKKLTLNQKELLLNSGIGLVEYDAIAIRFLNPEIGERRIKNAIFTSKNAVKAIEKKDLEIENCFCVGEKTSAYLRAIGFKVQEIGQDAKELANGIIENYQKEQFIFFSGNKRREELPQMLKQHTIHFKEIEVYKTGLNLKKFDSDFDGVLFYSPSGVESFTEMNKLETIAFCIGETTASEAKKYTQNVLVATKPTIENVIVKAVSNLKNE